MVSWLDMVSLAVYASASLTIRSPSAETPMLLLIFDSRSTLVIVLNMRSPVLSMFSGGQPGLFIREISFVC